MTAPTQPADVPVTDRLTSYASGGGCACKVPAGELEAVLGGFYDGLRLATMLVCLGAANALANPRRLLRTMPPALHEVSTAVVVALSVFPQLAESLVRVRRARRLRPQPQSGRVRALLGVVVPVLEDALDRSLLLAASMDSRGYGRRGDRSRRAVAVTGALLVAGLCGICVGVYALLDATTPRFLAGPVLLGGVVVGLLGLGLAGRGVQRTAYRPDRWRLPELAGVAAVPVSVFCTDPDLGRTLVRFAFCKRDEVLAEAVDRLAAMRVS